MLNVKVGELAIKVKGDATDTIPVGAIVVCLSYTTEPWLDTYTGEFSDKPIWNVEFRGSSISDSGEFWACFDENLRPLRDEEGDDESLSWSFVPTKEMS